MAMEMVGTAEDWGSWGLGVGWWVGGVSCWIFVSRQAHGMITSIRQLFQVSPGNKSRTNKMLASGKRFSLAETGLLYCLSTANGVQ